jgi:hypothetical protein
MIRSAEVRVTITATVSDAVTFEVVNDGASPIWLVVDPWFVWHQRGRAITLSFARGRLQAGAVPFGYFNPEVQKLGAGERWNRSVPLSWPLSLSGLWNQADEAMPKPGEYDLRIEVGFGRTPHPPDPSGTSDVEQDVLTWQTKAQSASASICLP